MAWCPKYSGYPCPMCILTPCRSSKCLSKHHCQIVFLKRALSMSLLPKVLQWCHNVTSLKYRFFTKRLKIFQALAPDQYVGLISLQLPTAVLTWQKRDLSFFLECILCFSSSMLLLTLSPYTVSSLYPVLYLIKHVPSTRKLMIISMILFYLPHDWGYQLISAGLLISSPYHYSERAGLMSRQTRQLSMSWSLEIFHCSFLKGEYLLRLRPRGWGTVIERAQQAKKIICTKVINKF